MNILLNKDNIAIFLGEKFDLRDDGVYLSNGAVNTDNNASNCTVIDTELPIPTLNNIWKWDNDAWVCIDPAQLDAYYQAQKDLNNANQKEARAKAYKTESDPIFFKWQRGEATEQEWKDAVANIQTQYPYQE